MAQTGEMSAGNRRTAARVDAVENHRCGSGHPQVPAVAHLSLKHHEDLPTGLVVVKQILAHLLAVERLEHRFEHRGDRLQSTGHRAGGNRQAPIAQIL